MRRFGSFLRFFSHYPNVAHLAAEGYWSVHPLKSRGWFLNISGLQNKLFFLKDKSVANFLLFIWGLSDINFSRYGHICEVGRFRKMVKMTAHAAKVIIQTREIARY